MGIQGRYLRAETGDLYRPTTNNVQTAQWTYIRQEDGTDILWGPQGLTSLQKVATLRLGPGDVGDLFHGSAP